MIRNQIKKYPRKILSFGKRIIKKIFSIAERDQDTHVHIQKQTSANAEAENSSENISEKIKNTSSGAQSHSAHEEKQIDSVLENPQEEALNRSKNVSENITIKQEKETQEKETQEKETQEESSSIEIMDSPTSQQNPDPNADEKKSSLGTGLLIDPEPTPNPNCYKFTLNTNIGRSFSCSPTENPTHHIGAPLLAIDGIVSIFGVNNFLVMNKEVDRNWDDLIEPVVEKIEEVLG